MLVLYYRIYKVSHSIMNHIQYHEQNVYAIHNRTYSGYITSNYKYIFPRMHTLTDLLDTNINNENNTCILTKKLCIDTATWGFHICRNYWINTFCLELRPFYWMEIKCIPMSYIICREHSTSHGKQQLTKAYQTQPITGPETRRRVPLGCP